MPLSLAIEQAVFVGSIPKQGIPALFTSVYLIVAVNVHKKLERNSQRIAKSSKEQLKALQEGLGAIRDVLLDGSQHTYLAIYRRVDRPQRQLEANNQFLGGSPRYVVEAVGLLAIAGLGFWLTLREDYDGIAVIPLLGFMALGAQRLLPALQQVYAGWSSLKASAVNMDNALKMLDQPLPLQLKASNPLKFDQRIQLQSVGFRYNYDQPYVLRDLNLDINRKESIGLIGSTGSGKSTLVDLLMGLLQPTEGQILVDGSDLHDTEHPERLLEWRAAIAHVPQSIFLADSSIAENIAFGLPKHKIDLERVRQAAYMAQISSFIESNSEGYDTFVGERGVRLSGGQRQRIGIARALYKKASIIVLDEATSALDSRTEKDVIKSIERLNKEITIIIIAHRLSTLTNCTRIFELSPNSTLKITTPSELL